MESRAGSFVPFTLNQGSAEDRAKAILAEARAQIKLGAKAVGIICPVVRGSEASTPGTRATNGITDQDLANVLEAVNTQLKALPEDDELQGKFQFLPIPTAHTSVTSAPTGELTRPMEQGLDGVRDFLADKNSVLGWESSSFSSNTLNGDQKSEIHQRLGEFKVMHPAAAVTQTNQHRAGSEEQKRRDAEQERIDNFSAKYKVSWREKNKKQDWTNIVNQKDLEEARELEKLAGEKGPTMSSGVDDDPVKPMDEFKTGYYRPTGTPEYKNLAILHFQKENMTVSILKGPGRIDYRDIACSRDFLQSQGCTAVTINYDDAAFVKPVDTIKFLLDSIYKSSGDDGKGWEKAFDNNGNPKGSASAVYKEPPVEIKLGSAVQAYIKQNIGYLDSKNPIRRRRAERCQRMMQLAALSRDRMLEYRGRNLDAQESKIELGAAKAAEIPTTDNKLEEAGRAVADAVNQMLNTASIPADPAQAQQSQADSVQAQPVNEQQLTGHALYSFQQDDGLFEPPQEIVESILNAAHELDAPANDSDPFQPHEKAEIKDVLLEALNDLKSLNEIQPETKSKMNALAHEFEKNPEKQRVFNEVREKYQEALENKSPSMGLKK